VVERVAECETSRQVVLSPVHITMAAGLLAAVAAARVIQLGLRFDDERGEKLSRALVGHGAAVLVLAATVLIAGWLPWPIAVLTGGMAIAWGATAIVAGRRYDPSLTEERALEEARRDERPARPKPEAKRFDQPASARDRERTRR
jgi:hypothetical protein